MATFLWFLFDWRGRLRAGPYRLSMIILGVTVAALHIVPFHNPNLLVFIAGTQLFIQASLDAKRLHDAGLSAIWVLLTSAAGIALFAALHIYQPELTPMLMERLATQIGPQAQSPFVFVVFSGLAVTAGFRTTFLSARGSQEAGAIYEHDPLARVKAAGDGDKPKLDADALIAKALEEKRLQDAAAAMRQAAAPRAPSGSGALGARKAFGRRVA